MDSRNSLLPTHLLLFLSGSSHTRGNRPLLQGCYDLISGPMDRHAWGVAWFGFAILCWTVSISWHVLYSKRTMIRRDLELPLVSPTSLDCLKTMPWPEGWSGSCWHPSKNSGVPWEVGKGCTLLTRTFFWVIGMHSPAPPGLPISLIHYSEISDCRPSSQTLICLAPSKERPWPVSPVLLPVLLDADVATGWSSVLSPGCL